MDSILQQITDWLKEMLVAGIMGNLSGMFDSVNNQVGEIATSVEHNTGELFAGCLCHDTQHLRVSNITHSRFDTNLYRLLRADTAHYRP